MCVILVVPIHVNVCVRVCIYVETISYSYDPDICLEAYGSNPVAGNICPRLFFFQSVKIFTYSYISINRYLPFT
jgi:hypothetical protein